MSLNLCTIATEDWVSGHLVRWIRFAKRYNPEAKLHLYYIGTAMDKKFPGLRDNFEKVIEMPLEGRPQFNRIRMSATTDFGVDEILYCDCDADIIAPLDHIADGIYDKCTLACVESPAQHRDWVALANKKGWDCRSMNNGLLMLRDDWGERYDKAVKAVEESGASPRIIGTIAFNYMLNAEEGWGELDPKYGVIWWDTQSFVGAKIVQYCNDNGQAKRLMLEQEYRDSMVPMMPMTNGHPRVSRMRIDPVQENGLKSFCKRVKEIKPDASEIVEIGGYAGESAEIFSPFFDKVITVDSWEIWDEDFYSAQTMGEHVYDAYIARTEPLGNVTAVRARSVDAAKLVESKSVDVVYIDGSHNYKSVKEDISAWVGKIVDGGILGGHDYQFGDVKRAVDEFANGREIETFLDNSWLIKKDITDVV